LLSPPFSSNKLKKKAWLGNAPGLFMKLLIFAAQYNQVLMVCQQKNNRKK